MYPQRSLDPEVPIQYRGLLLTEQIQRVYLDELGDNTNRSIGVGVVQLVVESEETAVASARKLINQARQELADELTQSKIIELIETIVFYKFPRKSRQEIAEMFGLSELKQTRVYQEIKEEALLETVPRLLAMGLTVEQIAEALSLSVEQVQQVTTKQNSD